MLLSMNSLLGRQRRERPVLQRSSAAASSPPPPRDGRRPASSAIIVDVAERLDRHALSLGWTHAPRYRLLGPAFRFARSLRHSLSARQRHAGCRKPAKAVRDHRSASRGFSAATSVFWKGTCRHDGRRALMLLHANAHHMAVIVETLPEAALSASSKQGLRLRQSAGYAGPHGDIGMAIERTRARHEG